MDTLIYFAPETTAFPSGTVHDIAYSGKTIRIIYYAENMGFVQFLHFKHNIRKKVKNCKMFKNTVSNKFKNKKLYKDGSSLILSHINDVIMSAGKENMVIFSVDISDLKTLCDILTQTKNIEILTLPYLVDKFENVLLENYGIAGAVSTEVKVKGKTVLIMPGGEIFASHGADRILNMSKTDFAAGLNITFKPPKQLKKAGAFIKSPDCLETAMFFFEIGYSAAKLSSVKFIN